MIIEVDLRRKRTSALLLPETLGSQYIYLSLLASTPSERERLVAGSESDGEDVMVETGG